MQLPKAGAHHGDSMEGNGLFGLYRRSDYKNASLANSFDFGVTETPWIYLPLPVVPVPVAPEEPLIDTVSTLVAMPPAQYPLHPSNNSYGLSIRCFKNKPQISGIVEVLPTPVEAEKEEVINQITLNQPGSILTSGWSCVEPSPCPTYDTYSGGTTWIKTFTPSTLTDLSEEVIFKDVSSSAT
ncbi:MAG: hypothetical protein LBO09_07945 [Candidatus Peribacteria bacterium]|nr:hypothetical protein [Candidatus Peribacteria bacterium]